MLGHKFKDREHAGEVLAEKLKKYRGTGAMVLALPRGGVVVGFEIAKALDLPLDVIVTKKIGHPSSSEYAICAVNDAGKLLCNEDERKSVSKEWLREKYELQVSEARRRVSLYRENLGPLNVSGQTVIIVDDGIATGLTMRLAIDSVKTQNAAKIIIAVPVASMAIARVLSKEVNEFIVLLAPKRFLGSVGAHYKRFEPVDDQKVVSLLKLIRR